MRLSATLTKPLDREASAAVLCIGGSGPLDRDENTPGQRLDIYNRFAESFATAGIACLRYDKRGCGRSTGHFLSAGQEELLEDARAALASLRSGGWRRVVVLGHSEGTVLAARLADRTDALVLLAPSVTPMREILRLQAEEVARALSATRGTGAWLLRAAAGAMGGIPAIQARLVKKLDRTTAPVIRHFGRQVGAKNLRELLALDLAAVYATVRVPTLLVSGGKDVQCPPADGARIAAIIGPLAQAALVPDLTHLLRRSDQPPGLYHYAGQLAQPVDPELVRDVTKWIGAL